MQISMMMPTQRNFFKRFTRLPENILEYALKAYSKPVENAESYTNS